MSTDQNTANNLPSMAEQGQMLGLAWLNDYQQKLAAQRLAYANACGVPVGAGSGAGISLTTNNFPAGQQASGSPASPNAAPPAAPASNGSSLLKTAAIAAGMATGGAGLLGGGMLLNSFLNKPPTVQVQQQPGQVTIGIDDNGQLYNPNAGSQ